MTTVMDEVERPVTVGVTGSHSTGKTTFLAQLAHELSLRHIQVATVADLGEHAQRMGIPLLFNHTWASTLWFITRGISNELEAWPHADVVLVDRPVPDALGYYRAALDYRAVHARQEELNHLTSLVRGHSRRYDPLFRTTLEPSIPLGRNKPRDTDARFRALADRHIGRVLIELDIPHVPLAVDGHDQALAHALDFTTVRLTSS